MPETETKRDAAADLALCEAAPPGPWERRDGGRDPSYRLVCTPAGGMPVLHSHRPPHDALTFACMAREALPHWIARAQAAEAENERLRGLLEAEPVVKRLEYTAEDGIRGEISHWAVRHLAASLRETFRRQGGENWAAMVVDFPPGPEGEEPLGPLEVTIRRKWGGKTPVQQVTELRAELAEAKRVAESLAARCAGQSEHIAALAEKAAAGEREQASMASPDDTMPCGDWNTGRADALEELAAMIREGKA